MESLLKFFQNYAAHGEEIAVRQRRGYRSESCTYGQIAQSANRLARELEARGINKGDAVLLWGENSAEWITAFLGCMLCGAVIVPIDHASSKEFARRVSREVNAKLLFCASAENDHASIPAIPLGSLSAVTARHDSSPYPSPPLSRQDPLEIIFTSGTTAEPRGVVISHGNVLANIEPLQTEIQKYLRYEKFVHPLRFLNLLPLSHVFGQMLGVFIPSLLAGTVVFIDSLRPAEFVDTIRRERVSVVVAVPRFIESLRREVERHEERAGRIERFRKNFERAEKEHFLRRWWRFRGIHARLGWKFWAFISGGAALPQDAEKFWNRLGYAVIQGYGMTETTSLISLNHPFHSTQGSIGKVFPGMEVRVDENGEILVRGENLATAYRQNGQMLSVAEPDGWFRTGDIAEKDVNGGLYFKGRRKNVIVTPAGMNVYPEDLEKALRAQPGLRDCVVVGLERDGNAEPCAVLLLNGNAGNPAAVIEGANQTLAEYQKMRAWFLWPEPDFPRTPTQKPILPRIRDLVQNSKSAATENTPASDSLAGLITGITGRPVQLGSGDANLETDLHLTSLDRVELMSALEERHQVDLNEAQFQDVSTVAQLEKLLVEGSSAPIQHVYPTWPQHWLINAFRLTVYYLLAWPATYLLAAPRIRGRQNLRGLDGPVLVVSNHVTYLDIAWILPALPARLRNRLATAMGGERLARMRRPGSSLSFYERFLERLRYFLAVSLFNVFPLPQQSGFLQSFHFAGNLADRQWNVLVFPEGKTTEDGEMAPFRSGIGLLAKQLNIPVVPIYLGGLYEVKRSERSFARPGQVQVKIGAPMRFSSSEDANAIATEIEHRVRELQSV
ncbi:MAG TPA: AMP-binding protein [Candidatus Acidoferrum sp.]|nr:AMP-binding protein [Candidatus Acidoferrum sp.]